MRSNTLLIATNERIYAGLSHELNIQHVFRQFNFAVSRDHKCSLSQFTKMKIAVAILIIPVVLLKITKLCSADFDSAGPIQIVTPINQAFELEIDELNHILDVDEIKDRHIAVVSIAGASRQGKSFLLNFFLKYLYAQVSDDIEFSAEKKTSKFIDCNRMFCVCACQMFTV